ncbi:hypothetical protein ACLH0K_02205 [Arthrobacter sp. MPF02]|uniref:hypothetical protein n=1 Tax=Arthrobacter sp. MPF02 TaxID=3388492 RepID=UPI003984A40F
MSAALAGNTGGDRAACGQLEMLVIRIADGDHGAFEELYARTARRLFGLATRVAQRPELAEEIVQDVYVGRLLGFLAASISGVGIGKVI